MKHDKNKFDYQLLKMIYNNNHTCGHDPYPKPREPCQMSHTLNEFNHCKKNLQNTCIVCVHMCVRNHAIVQLAITNRGDDAKIASFFFVHSLSFSVSSSVFHPLMATRLRGR